MTERNTKILLEAYPKIFPSDFYFECGNGWFWLISNLCEHVQKRIDMNAHLEIPQVVAIQVKEKYGSLRFYFSGGDEIIHGYVDHTEYLSYRVCEFCGSLENVGHTVWPSWIKTLCKSCYGSVEQWKDMEWKAV